MSAKTKPSRIRIEFNRQLESGEREDLKNTWILFVKGLDFPESKEFLYMGNVRLSGSDRLYAESRQYDSRALFMGLRRYLEDNFVNLYPKAVKTFRELESV